MRAVLACMGEGWVEDRGPVLQAATCVLIVGIAASIREHHRRLRIMMPQSLLMPVAVVSKHELQTRFTSHENTV